jgi:FkbM family methyltransferase
MKKIKKLIIKIIGRTYFQWFFEGLYFISLKGMNYGSANNPEDSGELWLLKKISKEFKNQPVIFDVGSNNGQYLGLLLDNLKKTNPTIHCFEPDENAFSKLQKKYGNNQNVILNKFALGDKNSKSILFSEKAGSVTSSLVDIDDSIGLIQNEIEVKTLDSYCNENNINKIDFLKIDTEGFETNVIIGSKNMIDNNKINKIQLEHGSIHSIIMGASLYNFKKLMPNLKIFHIKQNGVSAIKYNTNMEIYFNSNYYFELKK